MRPAHTMPWLLVLCALAGCDSGGDDVMSWMAQQRQQATGRVEPVQPPSVFQPESYAVADRVSPFSDDKLMRALRSDGANAAVSRLLAAEEKRRREPLEDFPLDAMAMVGFIQRGNQRLALVKVNDQLHQVKVGNYMGQNMGRVIAIHDHQITLREIVQDAAGEWVERTVALQLHEGAGK